MKEGLEDGKRAGDGDRSTVTIAVVANDGSQDTKMESDQRVAVEPMMRRLKNGKHLSGLKDAQKKRFATCCVRQWRAP